MISYEELQLINRQCTYLELDQRARGLVVLSVEDLMPWYDLHVRRKKVKHSDTRRCLCRYVYMVVHSRQSQDRIMITEHLHCEGPRLQVWSRGLYCRVCCSHPGKLFFRHHLPQVTFSE